VCAFTPGHGFVSRRLLESVQFRFMRWRLGIRENEPGAASERAVERVVCETVRGAEELDAAVVLAFDAVYDDGGRIDRHNTHLYVSNEYVIELAARHRCLRFGASIHPYRRDAVNELERCAAHGAVLVKWLPLTQRFNPADPKCIPFYEALAHHRIALLSHTGSEFTLPNLAPETADPALLEPALRRGVHVIAAHCGSRMLPWQRDYVPTFMRLAHRYEHLYGDTSALNSPGRWYALDRMLGDAVVAGRLVHGSDWPILALPWPAQVGWRASASLLCESNWMRRDVLIKQRMGLDGAYWGRAARVLGIAPDGTRAPCGSSKA
jgi:predicted TIM-barrel fold metal-dependent hydrolase